jgi:hypothetical protein
MILSKELSFIDVFDFVAGLNLDHWDAHLQNAYYNGWKSQCFFESDLRLAS